MTDGFKTGRGRGNLAFSRAWVRLATETGFDRASEYREIDQAKALMRNLLDSGLALSADGSGLQNWKTLAVGSDAGVVVHLYQRDPHDDVDPTSQYFRRSEAILLTR